MSTFPDSPIADRVQRIITDTFETSHQEAMEHARHLAALAEGWAHGESVGTLDWPYRVKKYLGDTLKWRSETEREDFKAEQKRRFATYEGYIGGQRRRGL